MLALINDSSNEFEIKRFYQIAAYLNTENLFQAVVLWVWLILKNNHTSKHFPLKKTLVITSELNAKCFQQYGWDGSMFRQNEIS